MSYPSPPFSDPVTPKELAFYLKGRSARWVARECGAERIKTLPVGKPYLIPADEANRLLQVNQHNGNDHTDTTRNEAAGAACHR